MKVSLQFVEPLDYKFLYELLKEKEADINISHKGMPSWEEHCEFLRSEPYKCHFIIYIDDKRIGQVYLSDKNEIGIFIKKDCKNRGYGSAVLKILLKTMKGEDVFLNVSPNNIAGQNFAKRHGFKLIQYTYRYDSGIF